MKTLNGKYAVVTGGSKGIGKSVCLTLAKAGANIFILDTDKNQGLVVQDEASRLGVEAFFMRWMLPKKAIGLNLINS